MGGNGAPGRAPAEPTGQRRRRGGAWRPSVSVASPPPHRGWLPAGLRTEGDRRCVRLNLNGVAEIGRCLLFIKPGHVPGTVLGGCHSVAQLVSQGEQPTANGTSWIGLAFSRRECRGCCPRCTRRSSPLPAARLPSRPPSPAVRAPRARSPRQSARRRRSRRNHHPLW